MPKKKKAKKTKTRTRTITKIVRRSPRAKKIKLTMAGVKRAIGIKEAALAMVGVIAARAAGGFLQRYAPDTDPRLLYTAGAIIPVILSIAASGKPKTVIPIATGAGGILLADIAAESIADAIPPEHEDIAQAILEGPLSVEPAPAITPAALPTIAPTGEIMPGDDVADFDPGYSDAYGVAEDDTGYSDAYGFSGLGDVDMVEY